MLRLLGILTGSALAAIALVLLVGIPAVREAPEKAENEVITLPLKSTVVATAPSGPVAIEADPVERTPMPDAVETADAIETAPATTAGDAWRQEPAEPPAPPLADSSAPLPDEPADFVPAIEEDSLQWYAFWSPFRSEIAAQGFVEQLQRVTGLDYRVVSIKPGVYEVAFAYSDDADIEANLTQISAATGLDLPAD